MSKTQDEIVSHAYYMALDWLSKIYFMTDESKEILSDRLATEIQRASNKIDRRAVESMRQAVKIMQDRPKTTL
jgi:hypothetical protein